MSPTEPDESTEEPVVEVVEDDVVAEEDSVENLDEGEPDLTPSSVTKAVETRTTILKRIDRRALAKRLFREMDGDD